MNEQLFNSIILVFLVLITLVTVIMIAKKGSNEEDDPELEPVDINYLVQEVNKAINEVQSRNISEFNLNKTESLMREENKRMLRMANRTNNHGDDGAKEFLVDFIKEILIVKFKIDEDTIESVMSFVPDKMNAQDKFLVLLLQYKKVYRYEALKELILKYNLAALKDNGMYIIDAKDIDGIYAEENYQLEYSDKLDALARVVYQKAKGLGPVDEIRNMVIDEIFAGTSGVPEGMLGNNPEVRKYIESQCLNSYDSVWIMFQGKTIRLSFLSFGSNRELIRVCKNIYRYNNPGQINEKTGVIINESKDGARVLVCRPKFSASWAFLVRKFDSVEKKSLSASITDKGSDRVITILECLAKSNLVTIITGEMGCGKSTLVMSMIGALKKTSNIRTFEQVFELYANKYFPELNVMAFRKLNSMDTEEAFSVMRKTTGNVIIMGEVTTHSEANQMLELNQISKNAMFATAHMDTTAKLIDYFTDAKLTAGKYNDVYRAEKKVVETLNIDVHMVNDNGHRFIERITEIIPVDLEQYPEQTAQYKTYRTMDLVRYEEGEYKIISVPSGATYARILRSLDAEDQERFLELFNPGGEFVE